MTTSDDNDFTFIYDTTAGIPAVLMEYVYNMIPRLYVRTPDGRLIASCIVSSGTAYLDSYYHFDGLGNTKALTNSEATVTDRYTYDVWGNVTRTYGETMQPYLFVGQLGYYTHYSYYDKLNPFSTDSDKYVLLQLGVRYYQPGMGRFTQRDTEEDDYSRYVYVSNYPTYQVDPTGNMGRPPGSIVIPPQPPQGACPGYCLTGTPEPAPPIPNRMRGYYECMRNRGERGPNQPHNCWYQLYNGHREGWLTAARCNCEDVIVCMRRLDPRSVNTDLYRQWQQYCRRVGQCTGDPAYPPGTWPGH